MTDTPFPSPSDHVQRDIDGILDYITSTSPLLGSVRRVKMARARVEIPRMVLETSLTLDDAEVEDLEMGRMVKTRPGPGMMESVVLQSAMTVLPIAVDKDWHDALGEDERDREIYKTAGRLSAGGFELLAMWGDEEEGSDHLLWANDGFWKQARKKTFVQGTPGPIDTSDLNQALKMLESKYKRDLGTLYVYCSEATAKRLQGAGARTVALDCMPDNAFLLTHPDNLLFGIERQFKLRHTREGRDQDEECDEVYYAAHFRSDFKIQNRDAAIAYTKIPGTESS